MTKADIKRRVKQLMAREIRSGRFTELPGHIIEEPDEVQEAWPRICREVADQLDRGNRA